MFRNITIALVILALFGLGWRYFGKSSSGALSETKNEQITSLQYSNNDFGFSFAYPSNYKLEEKNITGAPDTHHQITLIEKNDKPLPKDGEGPVSITVEVLIASSTQNFESWLTTKNAGNFSFTPENALASTSIGGLVANMYRIDGLYAGYSNVLVRDGRVYLFSATYITGNDKILDVYSALINSVHFN